MCAQVSGGTGWAIDPIRGAGGRRRYNALRQLHARLRRDKIILLLIDTGVSLTVRGTQRALAQKFGVSEATISRDVRGILAAREEEDGRYCPTCGAASFVDFGVESDNADL